MPEGYRFLDAVTDILVLSDGVEVRAGVPRVSLPFVDDGIVQVRLHPNGAVFEEPPFSYGIDPDFWDRPDVAYDARRSALCLTVPIRHT